MGDEKQRYEALLKRQIERLTQRSAALQRVSDRYVQVRVGMALLVFGGAFGAFVTTGPIAAGGAFLVLAAIFAVVVQRHRRVERMLRRLQGWLIIKQEHIARMTHQWERVPPLNIDLATRSPLELDLDVVGDASLLRLLNTTTSAAGLLELRRLFQQSFPETLKTAQRQALVKELVDMSLFRDKLQLFGREVNSGNRDIVSWVGRWLEKELLGGPGVRWMIVLQSLAAITAVLFILASANLLPAFWPISFGLYILLYLSFARTISGDIFIDAADLQDALDRLQVVFAHLERRPERYPLHLRQLCAPFTDQAKRPSALLHKVRRVVNGTGLRRNPFLWLLLNVLGPWDFYFAYRLKQCQVTLAAHLPEWLEIWARLEALSALATFANLNPHYCFPTVTDSPSPHFRATALGHPLLPDGSKVTNDFVMPDQPQIGLITGSNMAGKSSFLRTVGLNLLLAYAGGPVDAQQFEITTYRLFSSIRLTDSVTDGISFFYAEVQRLRLLLDEIQRDDERPLFFLIDEIFRGTNNRERLIGSQSFIRELARLGGTGLLSTHDLELVNLADDLPTIRNLHFRETVEGERLLFDYALREGPCPTTNALTIMQLAGLPVNSMP